MSAYITAKVIDVFNSACNRVVARGKLPFNPVAPIKMTLMKHVQKLKQRSVNDADVNILSEEEQRLFEAEACKVEPES